MAGTAKPSITPLGPEVSCVINNSSLATGTAELLFNQSIGTGSQGGSYCYWTTTSQYIDLTIQEDCNLWAINMYDNTRYGGRLVIYRWNGTGFILYSWGKPPVAPFSNWQKFYHGLIAGRYRFYIESDAYLATEWYLEKTTLSTRKGVIGHKAADVTAIGARTGTNLKALPSVTLFKDTEPQQYIRQFNPMARKSNSYPAKRSGVSTATLVVPLSQLGKIVTVALGSGAKKLAIGSAISRLMRTSINSRISIYRSEAERGRVLLKSKVARGPHSLTTTAISTPTTEPIRRWPRDWHGNHNH